MGRGIVGGAMGGRRPGVGVACRIAELWQVKVNALVDRAEDPREMLGYSDAQQRVFLRRMHGVVADVAASRNRAEAQESQLRCCADRLRDQAGQAVAAGKEDLGRDASQLRAETVAHADDLAAERAGLRAEEERLSEEARRLETRFEVFRYRKQVLTAPCTAAAATAAGTSLAGVCGDAGDVAAATRRAEDLTAALQARAEALSEQI